MRRSFRVLCGCGAAALLTLNIFAEHSGRFVIGVQQKLLFAAAFFLLWTLTCAPFGAGRRAPRHRVWLWGLFAYYLWILANLLFFDLGFGRDEALVGVNLEPFFTIRNYLRAWDNGLIRELVVINLVGNLLAFAPMAVFLPALFRGQRNLLLFLVTIVLMVCAVEALQLYTGTGSCDIDDLILNTTGAAALWLLLLPYRLLTKPKKERYR